MRLFVTRFLLAYGLTVGIAFAGPLLQVKGGNTTIYLSDDMLTALTDCRLERVKPSVLLPDQRRIKMRIVGGALDADNLDGEATHNGGMTIVCWGMGTESVVTMQNFMLDSLQETAEITALVAVDGGETGRIPVLLPSGELDVDVKGGGNQIRVKKVQLTFTEEAAAILDDLFVLPEDNLLGSAWSRIQLREPDRLDDDDDSSDDDSSDDDGSDDDSSDDDSSDDDSSDDDSSDDDSSDDDSEDDEDEEDDE
jgi:hypothetical protein